MSVRNRFQFHNGTINTKITGDGTVDASDSFNSTTVQLIPWPNHRKRPRQSFQFHNGTINTSYTNRNTLTSKVFQFHNGTINTGCQPGGIYWIPGFNSTTVQLILIRCIVFLRLILCFNSTTVQLILNASNNVPMTFEVSIPQRYN